MTRAAGCQPALHAMLGVFLGSTLHFMSYLFLVRHGQASFLEPDYDKLSAKGEAQSRMLGEYWAQQRMVFDRAYSGPRVRQRETARIVGDIFKKAGLAWPEVEIRDEFDEFQAETVMERAVPPLVESDQHVHALHHAYQNADGREQKFKTFQKLFEVVIDRWAEGELVVPGIEPWVAFRARVQEGLSRLVNGSKGQCVVVFSSGGPIGVAMQKALRLSTGATLRCAWMMRNAAFSEFLFSKDRFTLSSYNSYPHLTQPGFITYR